MNIIKSITDQLSFSFKISPFIVNLMFINSLKIISFLTLLFIVTSVVSNVYVVSVFSLIAGYLCLFQLKELNKKTYTSFLPIVSLLKKGERLPDTGLVSYGSFLINKRYKIDEELEASEKFIDTNINKSHDMQFMKEHFNFKSPHINKAIAFVVNLFKDDFKCLIIVKHLDDEQASIENLNTMIFSSYNSNKHNDFEVTSTHMLKKAGILFALCLFSLSFAYSASLILPVLAFGLVPLVFSMILTDYIYSTFVKPNLMYSYVCAHKFTTGKQTESAKVINFEETKEKKIKDEKITEKKTKEKKAS